MKSVRIGTRGSKLALYQAYRVKEELEAHFPKITFTIEIIKTKGDIILDVPLSKIGDKGLFTKELETAMFNNEIDMAVHSLKDLPTTFPEGATLGAVLQRGDVRDALISSDNRTISSLTKKDVIATSSLRRKAQLLRINKDFKIVEIRGNVNTRIRKMEEGFCDVMVMAAAGLQRLEMRSYISELIAPELMIPACSQGAIGIEIREGDTFISGLLSKINHEETFIMTSAERAFLKTLEGGCQIPVGSYTRIEDGQFHITGFISNIDGSVYLKESASAPLDKANQVAIELAQGLYNHGGKEILESIRNHNFIKEHLRVPVGNKLVISTRALDSGDTLNDMLQKHGIKTLALPMIEIVPTVLTEEGIDLVQSLTHFEWIFFTSRNGVLHFFKHLLDVTGSTFLPKRIKIATIGTKTAAELEYYGYAPDFLSGGNNANELLDNFCKIYHPKNMKIFLALGNLAGDTLNNNLCDGNYVKRLNVYNTIKPKFVDPAILEIIRLKRYDFIVFTSPSTFYNFCALQNDIELHSLKIASIGITTTKVIRNAGIEPVLTAKKSTAEGLVDDIIAYFDKHK